MKKTQKQPDSNLALIAIILGATSFAMSLFTAVPAVILGIIALVTKAGNKTQAVLAIILSVVSTMLWGIGIWLVGFHLFNAPLSQQFSVPEQDRKEMVAAVDALNEYKKERGSYPQCTAGETSDTCADWKRFTADNPGILMRPVVFETEADKVDTQKPGTVTYAMRTACFVNTPTLPAYLQDDEDPGAGPPADTVALVYFHDEGRACYSTDQTAE